MIKIGDRVKQKFTLANRIGTVIGIWEHDEYIENKDGESILFACIGELKVQFDTNTAGGFVTLSKEEVLKI